MGILRLTSTRHFDCKCISLRPVTAYADPASNNPNEPRIATSHDCFTTDLLLDRKILAQLLFYSSLRVIRSKTIQHKC